ncbi:MAG: hypothetical protein AB7G93_16750 [Bdellovibrionales bacterium]
MNLIVRSTCIRTLVGCATAAAVMASGCSNKSNGPREPARSAEKPFELEKAELDKLESVGCHLRKSTISCDDFVKSEAQDRISDLTARKNRIEKQRLTLLDVQKAINVKIKSGQLSEEQAAEAKFLDTSIVVYTTELVKRSATTDIEISKEKLFLSVMGYKCTGKITFQGATKDIDASVPFRDSGAADWVRTFEAQGTGDLRAELKLETARRSVIWTAADSSDGFIRNLRHYIKTDGEFLMKQTSASSPALNCLKVRGSGTSTQISDRPVTRRYLNCGLNSLEPNPQDPKAPFVKGWSYSFHVGSDDVNRAVDLDGSEIADTVSLYANLKYGVKVNSNGGILRFEIYDKRSKATILEVSTSNSTPNLLIGLEELSGAGIRIQCGDDVDVNDKGR